MRWPTTMADQTPVASRRPKLCSVPQMPSGTSTCDTSVMYRGPRVSPVPCNPPVYVRATVMKNPETARNRSSWRPSRDHGRIVQAENRQQRFRGRTRTSRRRWPRPRCQSWTRSARRGSLRSGWPAPRFCPATAAALPIKPTDVQVISAKQLRVADGIRGLRFGAVLERTDEPQQHHAGDVHRHTLDAGRETEAEQRTDDRPVGRARLRAREMHDQPAAQQQPDADRRHDQARRNGAEGRAARAERRHRTVARNQDQVERDVQNGHADSEAHRRARVARRPQRAAEHEEQQHPDAEDEHRPQERQRLRLDRRRGVHEIEQRRREEVPAGASTPSARITAVRKA